MGDLGVLIFDDTAAWDEKLAFYGHQLESKDGQTEISRGDLEFIPVEQSEPLQNECSHFIRVVNENIPSMTGGEEGAAVVKVLDSVSPALTPASV